MPASLKARLQTHADIARALESLGMSLDAVRKADPAQAKDPELAQALREVLKDVSGAELKRLQATVGAGGAPSSAQPRATTGTSPAHVVARLPTRNHGKEPRIDANLPAVAVLLQTYDVDKKAHRPLERVLVHAAKVQEILSLEKDPAALVELVMAKDLRRHVFLLEGIGKLYAKRYDEAGETHLAAKELEDALGALSATRSNLAYARHVVVPADVEKHLVKKEADARRFLEDLLVDKWMPRDNGKIPAIKELLKAWGRAKWDDYGDDKKYVRNELVRRLVKLSDTTYDMNNLQDGIHELRRQLRWFPIYTESVNGLLQLDETKNPVAAYEPMLHVQLATSKYVSLPDDSREVGSIQISKSLYTALMQLTLDLGALKDAGEPLEELWHAWVETGHAKDLDDARARVQALVGQDAGGAAKAEKLEKDVHDNAHRLYAEMRKNRLVEKLAEQVKKG